MEYYDHYLIQSIDYQYEIINREYLSFTKNITEEDLQFIESIAPKMENYTTGGGGDDDDYENVIEFYHRWLYFMIRYSKIWIISILFSNYIKFNCYHYSNK